MKIEDYSKEQLFGMYHDLHMLIGEKNAEINRLKARLTPTIPTALWGCTYICPPDCGGKEYDEYGWIMSCPYCGNINVDWSHKHCYKCGQAIDWSDGYVDKAIAIFTSKPERGLRAKAGIIGWEYQDQSVSRRLLEEQLIAMGVEKEKVSVLSGLSTEN